ncbi:thioesterase II family protein [Streptomyces sp. NPDC002564]|uniref:thioesterase II family protein n=1 Tax=Streptomyces sp. NPDC002564 TaxID=3364649 RepID=UPI0036B6E908
MTAAAPNPGSPTVNAPYAAWLRRLDDRPDADTRLICLPHAGGSASVFRAWLADWDDGPELWAVQYPGREDRTDDELPGTLPELAQHIALALQWMADKPYTLFGHSMGAVVAYETARQVVRLGLPAPTRLIASGSPPPDGAAAQAAQEDQGPDVRWLREDGESPDPELHRAAVRTLEDDLALLTSYARGPQPLDVPITVLSNKDDPDMDEDAVMDWGRFTEAEMRHVSLPGDHFACYGQANRILSALRDTRP